MSELSDAVDNHTAEIRKANAHGLTKTLIDGTVWVRADSGSPEEELMMCRNTIADLITKIDVLASELSRLFSTLAGNCAAKDETSSRDRP